MKTEKAYLIVAVWPWPVAGRYTAALTNPVRRYQPVEAYVHADLEAARTYAAVLKLTAFLADHQLEVWECTVRRWLPAPGDPPPGAKFAEVVPTRIVLRDRDVCMVFCTSPWAKTYQEAGNVLDRALTYLAKGG